MTIMYSEFKSHLRHQPVGPGPRFAYRCSSALEDAQCRILVAQPELVVGAMTGPVPLWVPVSLPRTDDRGAPLRAGGRPLPLPSLVTR
jgi:hypothetical protein